MAANATLESHTYWDILDLEPCYDPVAHGYCTRDWTGTALDVLRHPAVPAQEKLWLVLRPSWLPDRILHESAVWCAEQALALVEQPDPRSVAAPAVKRRWLDGKATDRELLAAKAAAWLAAQDAARVAAEGAEQDAAWAAAKAAAWAAAWAAAVDAAGLAARVAAWDAARADARTATWDDARTAAWAAAWLAARDAQVSHLIEVIEAASA